MSALYKKIRQYRVLAKCEQPLHIGNSEGKDGMILTDPVSGTPFIQASGIAGTIADYVEKNCGETIRRKLFGCADATNGIEGKSKVVISDGKFEKNTVTVEMRTRCAIDGETGSVKTKKYGQLSDTEFVSAGAEFIFGILVYDDLFEEIEKAICAMHIGKLRFGGLNTIGCGKISLLKVQKKEYDFSTKEGRIAWEKVERIDDEIQGGEEITEHILKLQDSIGDEDYKIVFHANLDTSMLIKANMVEESLIYDTIKEIGERLPDTMSIYAGQGAGKKKFIIPGSSLKGVFRNRMESICEYLQISQNKIEAVFENRSNIQFEDSIIKNGKDENVPAEQVYRTRINKITGGVKEKALFSEMVVGGQTEISISVNEDKRNSTEGSLSPKACVGMLFYAIRDLAVGAVSIGSGAAIGRGFLGIGQVSVYKGNEKMTEFSFKEDVNDDFVKECLLAVKDAREE